MRNWIVTEKKIHQMSNHSTNDELSALRESKQSFRVQKKGSVVLRLSASHKKLVRHLPPSSPVIEGPLPGYFMQLGVALGNIGRL